MSLPVRAVLLASSAFLLTTPVHAQGVYWAWAFEPSVPIGPVRNAVSNASPAGASFGVRYLFEKSWSLGIGGHWAEFAQNYPRTTYPIENGALTGAAYRRVWTTSLLAEAHVYLAPDETVSPYLGVGAGASWMKNEVLMTDLTIGDDLVHGFTVSPEAGLLFAFDRDLFAPDRSAMQSVITGVRCTFSTAGSRDVSSTAYVGLTLGMLVY